MSYIFKSCSSKSVGGHCLEEKECVEKGKFWVKRKMPKVPTHKIFEERRENLFTTCLSDPSIRTTETKVSFGKGGAFKLYSETPSSYGGKGKYNNKLNIGFVQIGVHPLTRKFPSNASIIVCFRDNRVEKIQDSLLGLVESNLTDGPFYLNIFPNINLSLSSASLTNVLSIHILVKGFDQFAKESEPIVLTCRTCYKLNPDNFGPEGLLESPVGKTVFFHTKILDNDDGDDDVVQKMTIWDQVQLPCNWPPQLQINRFPRVTIVN